MEVVNTVGRRKAAVARVYVKPGKGTITVNHKPMETYFPLDIFQYVVKQPLLVLENPESYDITINLTGGGIHGQAEAARLGIARALIEINPEWRVLTKHESGCQTVQTTRSGITRTAALSRKTRRTA